MPFQKHIACCAAALLLALAAGPGQPASAQPAPKHEFRGAWIATVINLDWPNARGASIGNQQKAQLAVMLDKLQAAGVNAVFFQVRSEADAMYESPYEPWSYWLTGAQGVPPNPFYDPLAFAIEEARKRGMELHAWFNPYRAVRGSGYPNHASHVSARRPEWTLSIGRLTVLNPGLQEVRDYIATVIADVVRRYDIDGVHFDDYFYPYPPNQITSEDRQTFNDDPRGFRSIGAWRRDNVNLFVAQVADSVNAIRPSVKFGISPFGIWKNGVPSGIVGLDAHNVIYGDATAWLEAGTIDYLVPQLYWAFGGGQDYAKLAPWWAERTAEAGRHLYVGHGLYRADRATFTGNLFSSSEVPRQVRFNRARDDIQGSVFFRAKNISVFSSRGFADTLRTDLYRTPALVPPMEWKDMSAPDPPGLLTLALTGADGVRLSWSAPDSSSAPEARRYAVYRVRSPARPPPAFAMDDPNNLVAVTGETSFVDGHGMLAEGDPLHYFVTSVSANSIESEAGNVAPLDKVTAAETEQPEAFALLQSYPNPFREAVEIRFALPRPAPVTLRIYDVLGREVAQLAGGQWKPEGRHAVRWDGRDAAGRSVAPGAYYYVLDAGNHRAAKGMVRGW